MNYNLDANAARAADNISSRLSESGKYIGTFTRAEETKSDKGTHGISFSFIADSGEQTDFLDLWTINTAAKQLTGFKALQAIMTCAKARALTATPMTVDKYDKDAKKSIPTNITGYPELTNKRIGLLLQKEISDNLKDPAKPYQNLRIVGCFDPETELTAGEILDRKTQPQQLAKHVEWLSNNPVRDSRRNPSAAAGNSHSASMSAQAPDDFEDDIPF